ncbi:uncharacterized protein N7459_000143 [Penicillium hispanicum]|uniref:uncharacterized protein n=1 Tax=Penicillium hispanicum TaxID=1080232 RepID=UPI002540AD77|nr:uncharacterized protein N7459_000143 [Penicillium hispanicum]KAJ5593935.1 hypothetical protein N7459_000143 [Penicillium hispanicum]
MLATVRFRDSDAFEAHNESVVQILANNGFPKGSYPATRRFPPIYVVAGLQEESPAAPELGELNGVIVEFHEDE